MALHMRIWHHGACSVLICQGDIDVSTTPQLERALELVTNTAPSTVIVDMHDVSFAGADGVERLRDAVQRWSALGILTTVLASSRVEQTLALLRQWERSKREAQYRLPPELEAALLAALAADPAGSLRPDIDPGA